MDSSLGRKSIKLNFLLHVIIIINRSSSMTTRADKLLQEIQKGAQTISTEYKVKIKEAAAKKIGEMLKTNRSLTSLKLQGASMGNPEATLIAEGLRTNTTLTTLDLEANKISDTGIKAIAAALQKNTGLKFLGLEANRLADEGAIALADALRINKCLQTLILDSNYITEKGIIAIARALRKNTALRALEISSMEYTLEAIREIAKMLMVNKTLQRLDISEQMLENGMKLVLEALLHNTTLTSLLVRSCHFDPVSLQSLTNLLTYNQTLRTLTLRTLYYNIRENSLKQVIEALAENSGLRTLDISTNLLNEIDEKVLLDVLTSKNFTLIEIKITTSNLELIEKLTKVMERNRAIVKQLEVIYAKIEALEPYKKPSKPAETHSAASILETRREEPQSPPSAAIQKLSAESMLPLDAMPCDEFGAMQKQPHDPFAILASLREDIAKLPGLGYPAPKIAELENRIMLNFSKHDIATLEPSFLIGQLESIVRSTKNDVLRKKTFAELAHHHLKTAHDLKLKAGAFSDSATKAKMMDHYLLAYLCGKQGEDHVFNQQTTAMALGLWINPELPGVAYDTEELETELRMLPDRLKRVYPWVQEICKYLGIEEPKVFKDAVAPASAVLLGLESTVLGLDSTVPGLDGAALGLDGASLGMDIVPSGLNAAATGSPAKVPVLGTPELDPWDLNSLEAEFKMKFDQFREEDADAIVEIATNDWSKKQTQHSKRKVPQSPSLLPAFDAVVSSPGAKETDADEPAQKRTRKFV